MKMENVFLETLNIQLPMALQWTRLSVIHLEKNSAGNGEAIAYAMISKNV